MWSFLTTDNVLGRENVKPQSTEYKKWLIDLNLTKAKVDCLSPHPLSSSCTSHPLPLRIECDFARGVWTTELVSASVILGFLSCLLLELWLSTKWRWVLNPYPPPPPPPIYIPFSRRAIPVILDLLLCSCLLEKQTTNSKTKQPYKSNGQSDRSVSCLLSSDWISCTYQLWFPTNCCTRQKMSSVSHQRPTAFCSLCHCF